MHQICLMLAVAFATVVVEGSVKNHHRGLRHYAEAPSQGGVEISPTGHQVATSLLPQALVHEDEDPLILDMSFVASFNPKNGTPWFRYKKVSDGGEADHSHFSGLTASGNFQEDIVHGHNVVRHRAGLDGVEWSPALEKLAAHRVTELVDGGCYIKHSSTEYRWYAAGFEYVGENLYKVVNMEPTGVDIADAWYAEIEDYTYGQVGQKCVKEKCADRQSPPCVIGHFTQMMWQRTTHIGCARAQCPNEAKTTFIAICHYGPGGNIGGQEPFKPAIASSVGLYGEPCPVRDTWRAGTLAAGPSIAIAAIVLLHSMARPYLPSF